MRFDQDLSLGRGLTVSLDASTRVRRRIGGDEHARVDELTPGAILSPSFRSRLELGHPHRGGSARRLGAAGSRARTRRLDRALSRLGPTARFALDLSTSLREQRPDGGREVREARMELRATF
ncbi:MAG: hypothetical protein U0527_08215 [Candidatus Eisenbacteria bacterium]